MFVYNFYIQDSILIDYKPKNGLSNSSNVEEVSYYGGYVII